MNLTDNRNSPSVTTVPMRESQYNDPKSGLTIDQQQLMEMFYRLECSVSQAHRNDVQGDNWNYIPYSHLCFYKTLKDVVGGSNKKPCDLRFLEMGCGLGTKLYIAAMWCNIGTVHGVEINPTYCEIARQMTTGARREIFCVDVREFDRYHEYDLIYSYGEVRGGRSVEEKVRESMKPGAILLSAVLNQEICCWVKETT